jgi:serine/threonine-protein kinase RsbT
MDVRKSEELAVVKEEDVVAARRVAREWSVELKFSLVDQTKIVTAASELARNTVIHGGGGNMRIEVLLDGMRNGLRLVFQDKGPGIIDLERALKGGFTTKGGMGLGLSGSKRLMNEFEVSSSPETGTRVIVTKWR